MPETSFLLPTDDVTDWLLWSYTCKKSSTSPSSTITSTSSSPTTTSACFSSSPSSLFYWTLAVALAFLDPWPWSKYRYSLLAYCVGYRHKVERFCFWLDNNPYFSILCQTISPTYLPLFTALKVYLLLVSRRHVYILSNDTDVSCIGNNLGFCAVARRRDNEEQWGQRKALTARRSGRTSKNLESRGEQPQEAIITMEIMVWG